jgi:hypothetical protein
MPWKDCPTGRCVERQGDDQRILPPHSAPVGCQAMRGIALLQTVILLLLYARYLSRLGHGERTYISSIPPQSKSGVKNLLNMS